MNFFVPLAVTLAQIQRRTISKSDAAHYRRIFTFSRVVHIVDAVKGAVARVFPPEFFKSLPALDHRRFTKPAKLFVWFGVHIIW